MSETVYPKREQEFAQKDIEGYKELLKRRENIRGEYNEKRRSLERQFGLGIKSMVISSVAFIVSIVLLPFFRQFNMVFVAFVISFIWMLSSLIFAILIDKEKDFLDENFKKGKLKS